MLFHSHLFIFLFLPLVLSVYYSLIRTDKHAARLWLLAASLAFYGWWSIGYLVLLVVWTSGNHLAGRMIGAARQRVPVTARVFVGIAIAANFAILGYYKYATFMLANVTALTGVTFAVEAVVLPLAISFHTFQQVAYLVDCGRGAVRRYTFPEYLLFVFFFPQLIAGPIVLHQELLPQLESRRLKAFESVSFAQGIVFFIIGLLKKLCLADPIFTLADAVYGATAPPTFVEAWGGTIAFGASLYFDFSAYSDMAVGLARMFGIHLPYNFNSPYKATSIMDFWRRWHMTLSRWLRDYLYIPLGGNRAGQTRTLVNLMVTMVLGGLWHGANWTFIVWGALHGSYLIINHLWLSLVVRAAARGRRLAITPRLGQALTVLVVTVAWVFLAAPDLARAAAVLEGMIGMNGVVRPEVLAALGGIVAGVDPRSVFGPLYRYAALVLGVAAILTMPNSQEIVDGAPAPRPSFVRFVPSVGRGCVAGAGFLAGLMFMADMREFVYFQF